MLSILKEFSNSPFVIQDIFNISHWLTKVRSIVYIPTIILFIYYSIKRSLHTYFAKPLLYKINIKYRALFELPNQRYESLT